MDKWVTDKEWEKWYSIGLDDKKNQLVRRSVFSTSPLDIDFVVNERKIAYNYGYDSLG